MKEHPTLLLLLGRFCSGFLPQCLDSPSPGLCIAILTDQPPPPCWPAQKRILFPIHSHFEDPHEGASDFSASFRPVLLQFFASSTGSSFSRSVCSPPLRPASSALVCKSAPIDLPRSNRPFSQPWAEPACLGFWFFLPAPVLQLSALASVE